MKKFIGTRIAFIGARLWENGGFWNEDEQYESLTVLGKLGYNLFIKGLEMIGCTQNDIETITEFEQRV